MPATLRSRPPHHQVDRGPADVGGASPGPGTACWPAAEASHPRLAALTAVDRRRFVDFGFGPAADLPVDRLEEQFTRIARRHPTVQAVVDHDDRALDYATLDAVTALVADDLRRAGVVPGDRVGIFLSRGLELAVGILATLRAGAAWVPQDARISPAHHLAHVVEVAAIDVVVTTGRHADAMPAGPTTMVLDVPALVARLDHEHAPPPTVDRGRGPTGASSDPGAPGDATACVIFTSGTTGTPNGVEVTHANLVNTLLVGPASLGIRPGMRVAQLLNIAFDMAVWEVLGALLHGATLVVRGSDIQATAATVDVVIATPSVLARLDPATCRDVRIVAVAGERCPGALAHAWRSTTRFHNSCGPTEVTIVNTVHRLVGDDELTIGAPLPNTSAYVLDADLQPCAIGEVGELWAGGACVTRGYLGNDELTARRYRPDPFVPGGRMFRTRDLVSWTDDGRLLHHGRTDDQVKVGGFRVELDAVTAAMEAAAGVVAATTLLVDGALVGVVAPADAAGPPVSQAVADRLPYYCVPSLVVGVEELPLTSRGKVDRRALHDHLVRQAVADRASTDAAPSATSAMATTSATSAPAQPPGRVCGSAHHAAPESTPDGNVSGSTPDGNVSGSTPDRHASERSTDDGDAPGRARERGLGDELSVAVLAHRGRVLPAQLPTWRRWARGRRAMHHNRLVATVLVVNVVVAVSLATDTGMTSGAVANVVVANFTLAALIRQQRVVNLLFRVATAAPTRWPLALRRTLGKVYHFGGIHVGAAIATTAWFGVLVAMLVRATIAGRGPGDGVLGLAVATMALLVAMVATAVPRFRARFHDAFERVHRVAGWSALALFALFSVVVTTQEAVATDIPVGMALATAPATWAIVATTVTVSSTWWHLRRVPVRYERPSDHVVIAHFDHGVTPFAGSSTALSRDPLLEWHHFANVPTPGRTGFRLTISRAGDWTGSLIDDLPGHVWVKGIPTAGVGNVDRLFRKVLWVATGSGIGPCLPHLLAGDTPSRLVWSTRAPRRTYGDGLVDEILVAQPDAVVWDTTARGKPDLVRLAFAACEDTDVEAVICISNKPTTWHVVEAFERRGIPAFGAIWDS